MNNEYNAPVILLVHTNLYAGNFERELCAFVTGVVGECEVGDREAALFRKKVGDEIADDLEDYVLKLPDDNGCYRPVALWRNADGQANTVAIFFEEWPEDHAQLLQERIQEYEAFHYLHGTWSGHRPGEGERLVIQRMELINRVVTVHDTVTVLA